MLLLLTGAWLGVCLLAVSVCVAAKRGDLVFADVEPEPEPELDWVATVSATAPAPRISAPRSPQFN